MIHCFRILIISTLLFSCNYSKTSVSPNIDDEFEIKYGQTRILGIHNLTIRFIAVLEDSRCPIGLECVWEGNAEIKIEVNQKTFRLNTTLEPKELEFMDYKIRLISVYPYPVENEVINPDEYKIKLLITN